MSVTVNSFPPFQSMNSPRGWVLAIIVLLHVVFFWLFASGLGARMIGAVSPQKFQVVEVPYKKPETVTKLPNDPIVDPVPVGPIVPRPEPPIVDSTTQSESISATIAEPTQFPGGTETPVRQPVVAMPAIDPGMPLGEPDYPANEIRMNHAGTVMLSIYVLENGRVGDVRVEQSSGFPRLDDAAARAAKRWRLKPGSQDGRPMAMWKTIPITFQLKK